jgi:hypothetical protein
MSEWTYAGIDLFTLPDSAVTKKKDLLIMVVKGGKQLLVKLLYHVPWQG